MAPTEQMTSSEIKGTLILSLIFACRMLGLFMVLPVLALYENQIAGATPALIGLAAGIYGFSQAVCQLPGGMLSDRLGRRPVILLGLIIFALGSSIAALSSTIVGLILGRTIQGIGAIGSPLLALVADTTRDQVRTRAMALLGMTIGATFVLAFLLGPWLNAYIGLKGIFWLTAALALGAITLLPFIKEQPVIKSTHRRWQKWWQQRDLWSLNLNIFTLHAVLTAIFLILPAKIQEFSAFAGEQVWRFYLPVMIIAAMGVTPFLRRADGMWQSKLIKTALILLGLSIFLLIYTQGVYGLMVAAVLFFISFNFLEASFPALISRIVPVSNKGLALGFYSCSQFLGMFTGGLLGGMLQQGFGGWAVGASCLLLLVISLIALHRVNYWQITAGDKSIFSAR